MYVGTRKEGEEMKKENCQGCYNDDYNHGLGGSKECWSFPKEELIPRKEVSINQPPPWNQKARTFPSCYQKQGFIIIGPESEKKG